MKVSLEAPRPRLTAVLLGAVTSGEAEAPPGAAALAKQQRLWGGRNGEGNKKEVLTRKLEAAKARQQLAATRAKALAKKQREAQTRLDAALGVAESGTAGAIPPLAEAVKEAILAQLDESGSLQRARAVLAQAKAEAQARSDAERAEAAAKARAAAEAQAAGAGGDGAQPVPHAGAGGGSSRTRRSPFSGGRS